MSADLPFSLRRVATVILTGVCVAACSSTAARGREQRPEPPVVDASRRVVGNDTVFSVSGNGYRVEAPLATLLARPRFMLDAAAREYRRYFGDDPPPIVLVLDTVPARIEPNDTTGAQVLRVPVPHVAPPARGKPKPGDPTHIEPNVAPMAVRTWLASRVDRHALTRHATRTSAMTSPRLDDGDDPRVPDWTEDGLMSLIVRGRQQEYTYAMLARQKTLIPLDSLFRMHRSGAPSVASSGPAPGVERGGGDFGRGGFGGGRSYGGGGAPRGQAAPISPAGLFAQQSVAVTQFLADREGPEFVGHVYDDLANAVPIRTALSRARMLPVDMPDLERAWRLWLSSYTGGGRGGYR